MNVINRLVERVGHGRCVVVSQIMDLDALRAMQGRCVWFVRQITYATYLGCRFPVTVRPLLTNVAHLFEWKVGALLTGRDQERFVGMLWPMSRDAPACCHWDDVNLRSPWVRTVCPSIYLPREEDDAMLSGIFTNSRDAETRHALIRLAGEASTVSEAEMQGRTLQRQCHIDEVRYPEGLLGASTKAWRHGGLRS